jgi:hypothetical protein
LVAKEGNRFVCPRTGAEYQEHDGGLSEVDGGAETLGE